MHNKRKLIYAIVLGFCFVACFSGPARGENPSVNPDFINESKYITQAELAVILVRSMDLESKLPDAPIPEDYVTLLDNNGIRPLEGWLPNKLVTNGDFAVILARAMGLETRLVSPREIYKENRIYIQKMWDLQAERDGYRKTLKALFQDRRYFPDGPPACPFGAEYADKDRDYMVDAVVITTGEKELYPIVKYVFTLKSRGWVLKGAVSKILTRRAVKAALRSPIFRAAPVCVSTEDYREYEQYIVPISPGGP